MKKVLTIAFLCAALAGAAGTAGAQSQTQRTPAQRKLQYQIATMESVLARAVEHGALEVRDRLQAVVPGEVLLNDNARVRGFPLPGYGIVFDIAVPGLNGTLPWSFRTLDQNNLGLDSALDALRGAIQKMNDVNLDQALKRVELQVSPFTAITEPPAAQAGSRFTTGSAASAPASADAAVSSAAVERPAAAAAERRGFQAILTSPDEEFRAAITEALMDAMLNNSLGLDLAPADMLTVVAKSNEDLLLGQAAPESRTTTITATSADLSAFRAGQISREEAYKRMTVTVF
jgi:hypothetical protein